MAASGQVVRGLLVNAADDTGIGGAMMTLIDRSDRAVEQVLTSSNSGGFELRATEPGQYRLRADRIGYATTFSEFFSLAAGDTLTFQMTSRVEPVSLEGIVAQADRQCRIRPEEGLVVARVWEEARKALAAAAWTQERGLYGYEMLRIRRRMDEEGRKVESEDRIYAQGFVPAPYVARQADSLVTGGFARFSTEGSFFWAPDADVLLADSFLDTHCLRIRRSEGRPGALIGLEFEPAPEREVAEIAGTMWLDPVTSRLQWLDFRFVNLNVPSWLMEASPGGRVEFQTLPNGTWIVTSWHLRMFSAGEARHPLTGRPAATLEGVTIESGEVLRVHGDEGVVFEGDSGRRIVGTVFDSLEVGLPGARVFLSGSGAEAVTDAEGRFELTHLGPGVYTIHYTHPYMEQLWFQPEQTEVELEPGVTHPVHVDFRGPSLETVFEDICDGVSQPGVPLFWAGRPAWRRGILTGSVTGEDGGPVADATVRIQVNAFAAGSSLVDAASDGKPLDRVRVRYTERTSASGFFRACWLPVGIPLEMVVLGKDERVDRDELDEALSLAALFPGRVRVITIDPEDPYWRVDLRVPSKLQR